MAALKMAVTGTFHAVRRQHAHRYLAAFEWRFNHRFDLAGAIDALARTLINAKPTPYRSIAAVKHRGNQVVPNGGSGLSTDLYAHAQRAALVHHDEHAVRSLHRWRVAISLVPSGPRQSL